jgi:gliding motility-associated-like protein
MKSYCNEACIICDIDGFTGRNNSNIRGQAPPGFCTSVVHHMQWIGFIAGTKDITLEVKVSNCTNGNGLEIGLYKSLDCNSFELVSECDTDIRANTTRVFKNTVPLIIGQYYYFVMDGNGNDICDWTIKVLSGSTKVAPLTVAPLIDLPQKICQNDSFEISTPGLIGATFYAWTIDSTTIKYGTKIKHTFTKPGKYRICLNASNVCSTAPPTCIYTDVLPVAEGKVTQEICFGECFNFHGKSYCESGKYNVKLTGSNGCDSIVTLDLKVGDKITASTFINICEGDTLTIGNGKLYSEGKHQVIVKNQEGCDIYLEVNLKVIICRIKASVLSIPVRCNGENTGQIKFKVERGTPPFTYTGFKVENPSIKMEGNLSDVGSNAEIQNVDEGNYTFLIKDTYGNSTALNVFVSQPSKLKTIVKTSNYGGFQISCAGYKDGYIKLLPSGATPPYTYLYEFTSSVIDSVGGLKSGIYKSTMLDANGCFEKLETSLRQPDSLKAEIVFSDPDCNGPNTGFIKVNSVKGGIKPYSFALNNSQFGNNLQYGNLYSGDYTLAIRDSNQCQIIQSDILIAAEIPVLTIPDSTIKIMLGDSVTLEPEINITNYDIMWKPDDRMTCSTCLHTQVQTVNDTKYEILAISKDGCKTTAYLTVKVEKARHFIFPNIFSPNGDNMNDRIRIFAGKDVQSVLTISIYDRWGNLVYKSDDHPPGLIELDWDAKFLNQDLSLSAYTWLVSVLYLDGIVLWHNGSLTVLK